MTRKAARGALKLARYALAVLVGLLSWAVPTVIIGEHSVGGAVAWMYGLPLIAGIIALRQQVRTTLRGYANLRDTAAPDILSVLFGGTLFVPTILATFDVGAVAALAVGAAVIALGLLILGNSGRLRRSLEFDPKDTEAAPLAAWWFGGLLSIVKSDSGLAVLYLTLFGSALAFPNSPGYVPMLAALAVVLAHFLLVLIRGGNGPYPSRHRATAVTEPTSHILIQGGVDQCGGEDRAREQVTR